MRGGQDVRGQGLQASGLRPTGLCPSGSGVAEVEEFLCSFLT